MLFLPFLIYFWPGAHTLKCFSCASSEYKLVLERSKAFSRHSRTPHFDNMCDEESAVKHLAPVENCQSTCITIYEPQYFGGLQSIEKPFLFIRGCADRIFESMEKRPAEIDFLHRAPICVSLQLSQIYPQVQANEIVEVCSCTNNGCNFEASPQSSSFLMDYSVILFVVLFFL